jgi:AcrR family transcriptional regulator
MARTTLRSDAARNRELVLDAAAAVFSEGGTNASTEEVARLAGVGVGTVFRHFPTKEMLLAAVLERMFERLTDAARHGLDAADAGKALFDVIDGIVHAAAVKKALADALSSAGVDLRRRSWAGPLRETLAQLLLRAQCVGAAREDVGITELMAVIVAASRVAEFAGNDSALRKRAIAVVFDGLRATPVPDDHVASGRRRRRAAP